MKQVQYRRAAQGAGFRPIQISGNEIARMREESARVVQGMRDVRDAEIKERERQLSDEKEAQRLEARFRDRNRQVETQNQQQVLTGLQAEARAKDQQFQQNQQDQTRILNSISSISQTASKVYQEQVEAAEDRTIAEELEKYLQNPIEEDYKTLLNEKLLDTDDERRQALLDEYQINGGDPLVVAKSRNFSPRVRREILKGKATYFYQYKYPGLLQEAIRKQEERLGKKMDHAELAGYITDVGRIVSDKFRTEGGMSLKPGSMRTALEFQAKHHQSILSGARADEIKHENQRAADNALTILTQNPTEFEKNIIPSFRTIYRVNGFDYAKAHTWYTSLATMRGPDGKFMFSMEKLAGTVLQEGQKPYAQEFPGRYAAIRQARLEADNTYRTLQMKSENLAYKEAEQQTLQYITENNTQDVVDQAVGFFIKTYGKVPESITKFQENYTLEAESKAKQIEQLESIPDGFIIRENVEALKRLDVKAGNDLDNRFAAQEAKYNSGVFKDQSDAFKTTANGVTSYGSQKPNDANSLFLQQEMRSEYRKRVNQAVAGGMDFTTAANTVAMQLTDEVKAGARDPNSLWYRKPSKAGGAADFPNLTGGNLTALEKARRNYQGILKSVAENGLEKTLDTAESVLTREEITSIVEGYGKPGFTIPTDVLAVSGMGNGLDPFTIINRQIAALGDPNLLPLEPPAIIQSVNSTMTEQQRDDLFNAVNGPMQRVRALQQGNSALTGNVSRFTNSSSMRAGSPVRVAIGSREEKAFIQTIREVEGTSGPNGYNTVYGGTVVPQLTQMTLGELYEAIKLGGTNAIPERLGGGVIPFKVDQYNSSASGALQLMPETLRGLVEGGGYSYNDIFSPETQDRMMLDLARQGGVDINNMSPEQMEKAGNIWAGASPRYGQTNRTAADSFSIFQRNLQPQ